MSDVEKKSKSANGWHMVVSGGICVALLTLCFIPSFASVKGHNRGFGNLWCGEASIASQENVDLMDCSMETRNVKIFLPLATIFQLFTLIQVYNLWKWHNSHAGNDTDSMGDKIHAGLPSMTVALSFTFFTVFGATYIQHRSKMHYVVDEQLEPLHSIHNGTFFPLFIVIMGLQGIQLGIFGIYAYVYGYLNAGFEAVGFGIRSTGEKYLGMSSLNPAYTKVKPTEP